MTQLCGNFAINSNSVSKTFEFSQEAKLRKLAVIILKLINIWKWDTSQFVIQYLITRKRIYIYSLNHKNRQFLKFRKTFILISYYFKYCFFLLFSTRVTIFFLKKYSLSLSLRIFFIWEKMFSLFSY